LLGKLLLEQRFDSFIHGSAHHLGHRQHASRLFG
jgi:hypothetical protein